jgi:hypothetical protein
MASAVERLAEPPTVPVTLILSDDNRVQLGGLGRLVDAFEPTLASAEALEGRLGRLAEREVLEAALQQRVPSGTSQVRLGDDTLEVLGSIWRAKGAPDRGELRDLVALSSALRERGGLRFGKAPPGRTEVILPTILVEYFCGPDSCYAVVYSAGTDTLTGRDHLTVDAATLLRLCPTEEVVAVVRGEAPADTLGDRLFTPVLGEVPQAVAVASDEFFPFHLGLVLALDDPLWLIPGMTALPFAEQETFLKDIRRDDSVERSERWATLEELRAGNARGDFVLVRSLAHPPPPSPPEAAELRAIQTLLEALTP